jgi:hypothetical protein
MKVIRITTILLLLVVAANALVAGYLFIVDPSGVKLNIPLSTLSHSPFNNFLIPGIILFTMNGVLNLVAAVAIILKLKIHPLLVVWQGIILIGWVVIQIILLQNFNFLHLIMIIIGLTLFVFGNRLNV